MSKKNITILLLTALLATAAMTAFGQTVPPNNRAEATKRLAILKSDATDKEKIDALREISFIATKDDVQAIAALLGDEKFSHMARYALEPIQDPSVDEVFRKALGRLKGRPLVGVIGSIGARRDIKAIKALREFLNNSDKQVVRTTARALGDIGNIRAATALSGALEESSDQERLAICDGLFRCAESLSAKKWKVGKEKAVEIYDELRTEKAPHQLRAGALRGAILIRGEKGLPLLREGLRSDDRALFSASLRAAQEMPGEKTTAALSAEVKNLSPDRQIQLIQTMGRRGDKSATPTLLELAKKGNKGVRLAAIQTIPAICVPTAAPALAALLDGDADIAKAAAASLGAMICKTADTEITKLLKSADTNKQIVAIELLQRRRSTASTGELLKLAAKGDPQVRQAAMMAVGDLGSDAEFSGLLNIVTGLKDEKDLAAAEKALVSISSNCEKPQSQAKAATKLLAKANPGQKGVLLRALSAMGGPNALRPICKALKDTNPQVRDSAVTALVAWKTPDAAPELLTLAKTSKSPTNQIKGLRGYIALIRAESLSTDKKLAMCKEATTLAKRPDEKKLLLGALATVPSPKALAMVIPYLDTQGTKAEASNAAVAIGEKVLKQDSELVTQAMKKVLKSTQNAKLKAKANNVLRQLK